MAAEHTAHTNNGILCFEGDTPTSTSAENRECIKQPILAADRTALVNSHTNNSAVLSSFRIPKSNIRSISRVAAEHKATNLGQGYANEPPLFEMAWGAMRHILAGTRQHAETVDSVRLDSESLMKLLNCDSKDLHTKGLRHLLKSLQGQRDIINQYGIPYGTLDIRKAISDCHNRQFNCSIDPETNVTVTLGSTEAFSTILRTLTEPGDRVVLLQPYHEMYANQCLLFHIEPVIVTLSELWDEGCWRLSYEELEEAFKQPRVRAFILNHPHNPSGKIFSLDELQRISELAIKYNIYIITDEIYNQIIYNPRDTFHFLFGWESLKDRVIAVNSISKSGKASGWRVGWILSPKNLTDAIRAVHDSLACQAPTPLQVGAVELLALTPDVYVSMEDFYYKKYLILAEGLRAVGFEFTEPQGAYYIFARYEKIEKLRGKDSYEAARIVLKIANVACIPGQCFYFPGKSSFTDYLRFAFCRDEEELIEGSRKLKLLLQ